MLLNDKVVTNIMEQYKTEGETFGYYFYAQTRSIGKMILLGALTSFFENYVLVQLTNKKLDIVTLSKLDGKPKIYEGIPLDDLDKINISKDLFGKSIKIRLKNGRLMKFIIYRSLVIKKQKDNVRNIQNYLTQIGKFGHL